MKLKLATSFIVIGALLAPYVAYSEDSDADRKHPTTFVKEAAITTKIKAKLASEKIGTLARIKVDTDGSGAVALSGNVRSKEEADKAIAIAGKTEGVRSVASTLQVRKDD